MLKKSIPFLFLLSILPFTVNATGKYDHSFSLHITNSEEIEQIKVKLLINDTVHYIATNDDIGDYVYHFPIEVVNFADPTEVNIESVEYYHKGTARYYESVLGNSPSCNLYATENFQDIPNSTRTTLYLNVNFCSGTSINAVHE
jgi:hypothetical protein